MADIQEFKLPDGTVRRLGNIAVPESTLMKANWKVYGDVAKTPIIPRTQWKNAIDEMGDPDEPTMYGLSYVHDQNGIGMCNASATVSAMESQRAKQGLPMVALSGGDLYSRIAVGGVDQGSLLEDGIKAAMDQGVASVKTNPYLKWRGVSSAAVKERPKYKVLEAFLCPSFDEIISALIAGFDIISGIWWYDNYTPDRSGWLPPPGGGRGGHATHAFKPTYRMTASGGLQYGLWHKNSWTTNYGLKGFFVTPESCYNQNGIGGWWAVRSVVDEGGVIPPEPTSETTEEATTGSE